MASQAGQQRLPLFYSSVVPLSSQLHPNHGYLPPDDLGFARGAHAIPVTVDEFVVAQRHFPVVFGTGPSAAPLALVGLVEGRNLFVDEAGQWRRDTYVPAYVRRYPFMLAKLGPESTDLSLCFDEGSGRVVEGGGEPLFNGAEPAEATRAVLNFCDQFEQAVMRTRGFMEELERLEIVIEGEVTIQAPGRDKPNVYRGFRMVSEEKLRELRGDQARKLVQNGMLGLIYAHLFSLGQIRDLFEMHEGRA